MRWVDARSLSERDLAVALARPALDDVELEPEVAARTERVFGEPLSPLAFATRVVERVAQEGDRALCDLLARLDGVSLTPDRFFLADEEIATARASVDPDTLAVIRHAAVNITRYHEQQKRPSWFTTGPGGVVLGQRVTPIDRVGAYIPGGRAPLISTALMVIIPAQVAGVPELLVTTPCGPQGQVNPYLVTAMVEAGATRILRLGGAPAVAALALGTETVPQVHKIVGPGNLFVQLAKKVVFGRVGIESLAGPSEILVIADTSADPRWVAADLLSQAEHDVACASILVTPDEGLAEQVRHEVDKQLAELARRDIAAAALARWGRLVISRDLDHAVQVANLVAAEHVQLMVSNPWGLLDGLRHAGAIFLGHASTEPIGDYVAGPSHVLPTNGAARYASPLGVDDFLKRSSVIAYTEAGLAQNGPAAIRLAEIEGLGAHAQAVAKRLPGG